MRRSLRERYFPSREEREAQAAAEEEKRLRVLAELAEWVRHKGTAQFRRWLAEHRREFRVKPSGDVGTMNYQLGVRDALEGVADQLEQWEQATQEIKDA